MILLLCSVLLFVLCGLPAEGLHPQVAVPSGVLRGYYDKSPNGQTFAAFEGIPYARPPIGKHRFRESQPTKPWRNIWQADTLYRCLQYDHFASPTSEGRVTGQEDCLYLNVYSPQMSQTAMLDVIVHIHGGAFMFGAALIYGPNLLMDKNVVYVNINYRLGPLGFLSTEDDVVPGNAGLKDQVLALKWIKDNIQYFGGNPNSITLTGMSAGGGSVTLHYLSPQSVGLFHKGIAVSGVAINPWVLTEGALEKAKKLAASIGCDAITTREMIECMKYRPAKQIVENMKLFQPFQYNPFSPFGPVVEKAGLNPFLTQSPYQLLKSGQVQDLPLMLSAVEAEGLYPGAEFVDDPLALQELEMNWNTLAPALLDYNYTVPLIQHAEVSQKAKTYYLKDQPISLETANQLIQMIGDRLFVTGIETAAKLHAKIGQAPTYLYYFTFRGTHSKSELLSKSNKNFLTCHGDDVMHVLSSTWTNPLNGTQDDRAMVEIIRNLWTSFAKTGVPEIPGVAFGPVANTVGPFDYLHIASPSDISMKRTDTLGHRQFWNSLPIQENQMTVLMKDEL